MRMPRLGHVPALRRGAVLGAEPGAAAARDAHGHGHRELATRHVAVLGQLVDDGVTGRRQEVREHDLDHRAHARDGHAQGNAHEAVLADGCRQDTTRELVRQADVGLEHAAVGVDVLAHEEDARVGRHLVLERGVDGLAIGELDRDRRGAAAGAASVRVDILARLLEGEGRSLGGSAGRRHRCPPGSWARMASCSSTDSRPSAASFAPRMVMGSRCFQRSSSPGARYLAGSVREWPR